MPARSTTSVSSVSTDEKITVNLGCVDLGQVDLLVQEGFYANRSDLIRTAIRNQLGRHEDAVRAAVARRTLVLGIQHYGRSDLEAIRNAGHKIEIRALGLVTFADDVTPELAQATITSLRVLGACHAPPALRRALALLMR